MEKKLVDWLLFVVLSIIWGSSFILMKIGLNNHLSPYQVAAIRIVSSGIVLLPIAIGAFKKIPPAKIKLVFLSGMLGSLLPAFLFCIAENGIDSSLAGMLNALTPVFVIVIGAVFFKSSTGSNKITGTAIAFAGSVLLVLSKGGMQESNHLLYVSFVILATIMYAVNLNMVTKYLSDIPSLQITAVALTLNAIPALIILIATGFFSLPFKQHELLVATAASVVLGIGGTAIATFLFYALVKRAGGLFASMVTYGIPFIAVAWGVYFKEKFEWPQVVCLLIILSGVYLANRKVSV